MQHSDEKSDLGDRSVIDPDTCRVSFVLCNAHPMASKRPTEVRTEKHRRSHKLVQTWVSPELWKALVERAKSEGRTLANFARRELGKLVDINE